MNVISLGAGVQSSTMALMASLGNLEPMPTAAIFADTQAETEEVYRWLAWLEKQLAFPVYRVSKGNLGTDELLIRRSKKSGKLYRNQLIPAYVKGGGAYPRKCTTDYKILPIRRKLRQLFSIPRGAKNIYVTQWLGISVDEAHRMRDSRVPWMKHRYPLIELGMTREDCLGWMDDHGYPEPPRSACYFCPYRSNFEWNSLDTNEYKKAIRFEFRMQEANSKSETAKGSPFLHPSRIPLGQVKLINQQTPDSSFGNECEGMCGL